MGIPESMEREFGETLEFKPVVHWHGPELVDLTLLLVWRGRVIINFFQISKFDNRWSILS